MCRHSRKPNAGLVRLWVETTRNFGGIQEGAAIEAALTKGLPQLIPEQWHEPGQVAARSSDEQLDVQVLSRTKNATAGSGGQALWVLQSLSAELSRQELIEWVSTRKRLTLRQVEALVDELHINTVQFVQHSASATEE